MTDNDDATVDRLVGLAMGRSAALCHDDDGDLPSRPWPREVSLVAEEAWLEGWEQWHAEQDMPPFEGKGGPGEHRTVGSHRAWCHQCHEWCYPSVDNGCACCEGWEERAEAAEALLREVRSVSSWGTKLTAKVDALLEHTPIAMTEHGIGSEVVYSDFGDVSLRCLCGALLYGDGHLSPTELVAKHVNEQPILQAKDRWEERPPNRQGEAYHAALGLVCEVALDWAGEYGYGSPERATEVFDAVRLLRPGMVEKVEGEDD